MIDIIDVRSNTLFYVINNGVHGNRGTICPDVYTDPYFTIEIGLNAFVRSAIREEF